MHFNVSRSAPLRPGVRRNEAININRESRPPFRRCTHLSRCLRNHLAYERLHTSPWQWPLCRPCLPTSLAVDKNRCAQLRVRIGQCRHGARLAGPPSLSEMMPINYTTSAEQVHEVNDYSDGPRTGVTARCAEVIGGSVDHREHTDHDVCRGWWCAWEEAEDAIEWIAGRPGQDRQALHMGPKHKTEPDTPPNHHPTREIRVRTRRSGGGRRAMSWSM